MRRTVLWLCLVLSIIHSAMKFAAALVYFQRLSPDMLQFMQYGFALPFLVILNIVVAAEPARGSSTRFLVHAANLIYLLFCIITVDQQLTVPSVVTVVIVLMLNGCAVALERSIRLEKWRNRRLNVAPQVWDPMPITHSPEHDPQEVYVQSSSSAVVPRRPAE